MSKCWKIYLNLGVPYSSWCRSCNNPNKHAYGLQLQLVNKIVIRFFFFLISQVTDVILQQTATGQRHRDRKTTGNTLDKPFTNSSLTTYFFGPNLDKKLTTDEFSTFQRKLRESLLKMEVMKSSSRICVGWELWVWSTPSYLNQTCWLSWIRAQIWFDVDLPV